jgi:hypothetical protein
MKLNELVKKAVQSVFAESIEPAIALNESTLADGSKVSFDKLEKGGTINRVADDGTLTPLEDGDFVIDGQNVTIKAGLVDAIKPVETKPVDKAPVIAAAAPIVDPMPAPESTGAVDIKDLWPTLLADKTEVYFKGDKAYDKDGNPFADGTYESIGHIVEDKSTFTITGGLKVETVITDTLKVAASEYIALAEFNKMKTEFNAKLDEMSKKITDSGIKQVPSEVIINEIPKTKTDKVMARLGFDK